MGDHLARWSHNTLRHVAVLIITVCTFVADKHGSKGAGMRWELEYTTLQIFHFCAQKMKAFADAC